MSDNLSSDLLTGQVIGILQSVIIVLILIYVSILCANFIFYTSYISAAVVVMAITYFVAPKERRVGIIIGEIIIDTITIVMITLMELLGYCNN